ncbi:MAG: hypothetical protein QG608_1113 [Actinomycetota bacterium]|nr:hypothetical protein [Actinomycetota bacterium]
MRLDLVRQLWDAPGPIACGQFATSVTKSTLSHHFTVLRKAGVIKTTATGGRSYNSLRVEEVEARFPGLLDAVLRS